MTTAIPADPPPDWATMTETVACPLCGYDLRGLTAPRCPECGFAFSWAELLDARRTLHPYLFEHHPRHNLWSFWSTYWRTCRPRRFWRDLSPAHPVRLGRLVAYAVAAAVVLLVLPFASLPGRCTGRRRRMPGSGRGTSRARCRGRGSTRGWGRSCRRTRGIDRSSGPTRQRR